MRKEEQAPGIECDDETEIEIALSEIIEQEQAADLERKENSNTLTKKNENDKASAEESRLKAMEHLGRTRRGMLIQVAMKLLGQKAEKVLLKLCKS